MQPYRGTPLKDIEEETQTTPKGKGHRRRQATDTLPLLSPLVRSGSPRGLPRPGSPNTPPRYIGKGKAPEEQQQQQQLQTQPEDDEPRCQCRFPLEEGTNPTPSPASSRPTSPVASRSSTPVLGRRPSQDFSGSYGFYQKVASYLPPNVDRGTLRIQVSAADAYDNTTKFKVYRCILVHAGDIPLLVGENSNQPRLAFQSLNNMAYAERVAQQGTKGVWPKEWWQLEQFEDRCSACELKRTEGAAAPRSPLWIRQTEEDLVELEVGRVRFKGSRPFRPVKGKEEA